MLQLFVLVCLVCSISSLSSSYLCNRVYNSALCAYAHALHPVNTPTVPFTEPVAFNSTSGSNSTESDVNLSSGAIAGLVIGCVVLLMLIGYCIWRSKRNAAGMDEGTSYAHLESTTDFTNAAYEPSLMHQAAMLPPFWEKHCDQQGNYYYWNSRTNASSWNIPTE